jgi:hypothetical protein
MNAISRSPFDASGVQFAWNASSIKLVETCLRLYQYVGLEGWRGKSQNAHLIFGAAYAKALETFFKLSIGENMPREEAIREVVSQALYATWEYGPDGTGGAPWASTHNTKTRENLIRSIIWYLDFWAEDPMPTVKLASGAPAVEHTFAFEVDNGILFAGHIDRLVEYGDHVYVQDQKTTYMTLTPRFFDQFSPDTQMSMYTFAGKTIFGGPVRGVVIDAAQVAVGFTQFMRGFTSRSEGELNEWYDDAMYWIEVGRKATREQHFPKNTTSCGNYGGCAFRHICSRAPSVRQNFLEGDFVRGTPMNPLEER